MGFHFMDPLAAIIVGGIILKICFEMVTDAVKNLMDKAYEDEDLEEIEKAIKGIKDVFGVKNFFAREMGRFLEFDIFLYVS